MSLRSKSGTNKTAHDSFITIEKLITLMKKLIDYLLALWTSRQFKKVRK